MPAGESRRNFIQIFICIMGHGNILFAFHDCTNGPKGLGSHLVTASQRKAVGCCGIPMIL